MSESNSHIHLIHYWNILLARRRVILVFTVLLMIAALMGSLLATRYYRAAAVVRIDPKSPVVFDVGNVSEQTPANMWGPTLKSYYTTQYRIMESRTVLEEAVRRLREEEGVSVFDESPKPAALLRSYLEIRPDPESQLVRVIVEYPDPDLAALFANAIAHAYIDSKRQTSLEDTRDAMRWLSEQLEVYRSRKVSSEEDVYRFQYDNALIGTEDGSHITLDTLAKLRDAWSDAHTERVQVQATYDGLVDLVRKRDLMAVATHLASADPVLQDMLGRHQEILQEQSRLAPRYKDQHPVVVRLDTEQEGLETQIRDQVDTLIASERARLDLLITEEERISEELLETQAAVQQLGETLIELELLRGEAERNEQFYRDLDTRLTEVGISQFLQASNVKIVEEALSNPNPVRPRTLVNLAVSLLVGLLGGSALALMLDYFDFNVKSREDVEDLLGVPFLGMLRRIPADQLAKLNSPLDRSLFVSAMPRSAVAESLRTIRTNAFFRLPKRTRMRLLVTSSVPREGKSFITANLSALIANNVRTLVIDGDLRRPTLHQLFQLPNDRGFKNVLIGECGVADAVQATHIQGLDILAAGTLEQNPAELLSLERLSTILDGIDDYDVIVIDSPPTSAVADASMFASLVDGLVFVIESGRTSRNLAGQSIQQLRLVNPNILGAIINKVEGGQGVYGYHPYTYDDYRGYYGEDHDQSERERARRPA